MVTGMTPGWEVPKPWKCIVQETGKTRGCDVIVWYRKPEKEEQRHVNDRWMNLEDLCIGPSTAAKGGIAASFIRSKF
jgi:hypothetical protein